MAIVVKDLGLCHYVETYDMMRDFSEHRDCSTTDQIWLLEHESVYTLGLSGIDKHLLNTKNIPVVKTDRGGQVTYHGPGQLVIYLLIDLNRRPYKIKKMVSLMEQSIIDYLSGHHIHAVRKQGAPGVYISGEKIAALGIRLRRGKTYHGLAFNIDMDLTPFNGINPCGDDSMKCTQLKKFIINISVQKVKDTFPAYLIKYLDQSVSNISGMT